MFAAVLDTCVLWPSLQRDFLLSMAVEGLYRPLWSDAILEELHRHEQIKLIERDQASEDEALAAAERLVGSMRSAFDDALVVGWEPLEGTFGLPDIDDEHVVAAAVVGGAGAIVTDNLKHFPADDVPKDIQVLSAVEFASNTADVNPEHAANAIREISRRHRNPSHTPQEILDLLVQRYGMEDVADLVSPLLDD